MMLFVTCCDEVNGKILNTTFLSLGLNSMSAFSGTSSVFVICVLHKDAEKMDVAPNTEHGSAMKIKNSCVSRSTSTWWDFIWTANSLISPPSQWSRRCFCHSNHFEGTGLLSGTSGTTSGTSFSLRVSPCLSVFGCPGCQVHCGGPLVLRQRSNFASGAAAADPGLRRHKQSHHRNSSRQVERVEHLENRDILNRCNYYRCIKYEDIV